MDIYIFVYLVICISEYPNIYISIYLFIYINFDISKIIITFVVLNFKSY